MSLAECIKCGDYAQSDNGGKPYTCMACRLQETRDMWYEAINAKIKAERERDEAINDLREKTTLLNKADERVEQLEAENKRFKELCTCGIAAEGEAICGYCHGIVLCENAIVDVNDCYYHPECASEIEEGEV